MTYGTFVRRWWAANSIGFVVAYLLYSTIAHGITGPHGDSLSIAQVIAHTIGLVFVAAIVTGAQSRALKLPPERFRRRLPATIGLFVAAFWFGWYGPGAPWDFVLGYCVLAVALWIDRIHLSWSGLLRGAAILIVTIFGTFCGLDLFLRLAEASLVARDVGSAPILDHTIFWLCAGGGTGIVGGLLAALLLGTMPGIREPVARPDGG